MILAFIGGLVFGIAVTYLYYNNWSVPFV